MSIQILSLQWLRTVTSFQYKFGGTLSNSISYLHHNGGIFRFYRGTIPTLIQVPLTKFIGLFVNSLFLDICEQDPYIRGLPLWIKSIGGVLYSGIAKIILTPLDVLKTMLQVEGKDGIKLLSNKISIHGKGVLYHGAFANLTCSLVGHYPWFITYNYLNRNTVRKRDPHEELKRQAFIGMSAWFASDFFSNIFRVLKTTRQTSDIPVSYEEIYRNIRDTDGRLSVFFRGLPARTLTNGTQSIILTIIWQQMEQHLKKNQN